MTLAKKIAWNTVVHTAGKFGASIIGIFVVALLTRYLGVGGYGEYTTIFAYLFFFAILSDLGLYVVTVNEMVRSPWGEEKFFNNVFTLRLVSAAGLLIIACFLVWVFPYTQIVKWGVVAASISILLNLLDQIIVAYFQTKINMSWVAGAEIVGKMVLLVLTLWIIQIKGSLLGLMAAIILGFGCSFLIKLIYINKFIKLRLEFNGEIWKKILRISWPIAITSVFSLIYFKADTLFLSILPVNQAWAPSSEAAVGAYGVPYKILEVLIAWPAIFMGLVSPVLARLWGEGDRRRFNQVWNKAFAALSIIIWPMIVGVLVLARPLIELIAGPEFIVSALVFRILIIATATIFITHLTTYTIIAMGEQKRMIKYYMIAAAGAVIGYLAFIPLYSFFAAAWVTVGVELFMLGATLRLLRQKGLCVNPVVFGKAMLAASIMGFGLTYVLFLNIFILILIAGVIYFLVLWMVGGIRWETVKGLVGLGNNNQDTRN